MRSFTIKPGAPLLGVLLFGFAFGPASPVGAQQLSEEELLNRAIAAGEKGDSIRVLKYLYAYSQRNPIGLSDPDHASSVSKGLQTAEDHLQQVSAENDKLRKENAELRARIQAKEGAIAAIRAFPLSVLPTIRISRPTLPRTSISRTAGALPADEIREVRLIEIRPATNDYWDWECRLEVEYTYDPAHGKGNMEIGGEFLKVESLRSGHSLWGERKEEPVDSKMHGTASLTIALRLEAATGRAEELQIYMYGRTGDRKPILSSNFKFSRSWQSRRR